MWHRTYSSELVMGCNILFYLVAALHRPRSFAFMVVPLSLLCSFSICAHVLRIPSLVYLLFRLLSNPWTIRLIAMRSLSRLDQDPLCQATSPSTYRTCGRPLALISLATCLQTMSFSRYEFQAGVRYIRGG